MPRDTVALWSKTGMTDLGIPPNMRSSAAAPIGQALFVIGAPRSGTSIIQRVLSMHCDLWGPLAESHHILEGPFRPNWRTGESNRTVADALTPEVSDALQVEFWRGSLNMATAKPLLQGARTGGSISQRARLRIMAHLILKAQERIRPASIHLLEKTPKNALRVPMLAALVPNSRFIFVLREPETAIDSLIEGWRAYRSIGPIRRKRFATYPVAKQLHLQDYDSRWWNFVLIPGWERLKFASIPEVAAAQYASCVETASIDLQQLPKDRQLLIQYEEFARSPAAVTEAICDWAGLRSLAAPVEYARRHVRHSRSSLRNSREISLLPSFTEVARVAAERVPGL